MQPRPDVQRVVLNVAVPTVSAAAVPAEEGGDEQQHPTKPKMTKAERRALQTRQREEKALLRQEASTTSLASTPGSGGLAKWPSISKKPKQLAASLQLDDEKKQRQKSKFLAKQKVLAQATKKEINKQPAFFLKE